MERFSSKEPIESVLENLQLREQDQVENELQQLCKNNQQLQMMILLILSLPVRDKGFFEQGNN